MCSPPVSLAIHHTITIPISFICSNWVSYFFIFDIVHSLNGKCSSIHPLSETFYELLILLLLLLSKDSGIFPNARYRHNISTHCTRYNCCSKALGLALKRGWELSCLSKFHFQVRRQNINEYLTWEKRKSFRIKSVRCWVINDPINTLAMWTKIEIFVCGTPRCQLRL